MDPREGTRDFWRLLVSFFLPPVGVFMQVGMSPHFWLNVFLTIFVPWVGGAVHALWVITTTDSEGGDQQGGFRNFIAVLLSAFLPPVGVLLVRGISGTLLINILLTLLTIPGSIHALWVITHTPPPSEG